MCDRGNSLRPLSFSYDMQLLQWKNEKQLRDAVYLEGVKAPVKHQCDPLPTNQSCWAAPMVREGREKNALLCV